MMLKSMRLQNIRSYDNEFVEFPTGSTLLSGDVGSGKSTLLLALDFALFGVQKGLSGSDILRHGKDTGSIEVNIEVDGHDINILRTLKRDHDKIVQGHGYITTNGSAQNLMPTEMKSRILTLFGYPLEMRKSMPIFRYTVYTQQEEMKNILLSDNSLDTLRKIFGVEKYGIIKSNISIISVELRALKRELEALAKDLPVKTKLLEESADSQLSVSQEIIVKKAELDDINKAIEVKMAELEAAKSAMAEIAKRKQEVAKKEVEISAKKRQLNKAIGEKNELLLKIAAYEKEMTLQKEKPAHQENALEIEKQRDTLIIQKTKLSSELQKLRRIYENGICDVCGQNVHDAAAFKTSIDEKNEIIASIENETVHINSRLFSCRAIEKEWSEYRIYLEKRNYTQKLLEDSQKKLSGIESEIKTTNDELNQLSKYLENIGPVDEDDPQPQLEKELSIIRNSKISSEKFISRLEQQYDDLYSKINLLKKEIEEKNIASKKAYSIGEISAWLDNDFSMLMENIEKHIMVALQKEFDRHFKKWFDIIMPDESLCVRIGESFNLMVEQSGFEAEYGNLSGGEKTAVALAYRLALNNIVNVMIETIKTKDIIILDEPTDGFSSEQLDRIRNVINELKLKQIILVSHESKIGTYVDNVINVYKEGNSSRIVR